MTGRGHLRASDADRDQVVDRLRKAASEGRLAVHELEHRVAVALRARTFAELEETTDDLPGGHSTRRRPAAQVALRTVRVHPALLLILIPLALAAAATVVAVSLLWCALALLVMLLGHRRRPPRLPWDHAGPRMIRSVHWRSDRGPWL